MNHRSRLMTAFASAIVASPCGGAEPAPAAPTASAAPPAPAVTPSAPTPVTPPVAAPTPAASTSAEAPTAPAAPSPPIDEKLVAEATGVAKLDKSADGVVKATWPRNDVAVTVDGWKMPPFMGLTSWAAFTPGKAGVAEAMVMGDLVLFEDEVNPVMSKLLDGGVEVTALHNHFFFDTPNVFFMHIGGEGKLADLAKTVGAAMHEVAAIRKTTPKPAASFGGPKLPAKSSIDRSKIDAVLGGKGQAKDGMYKTAFGRKASASCGCEVGKSMGVNTWAAFAGTDDVAVVDGDFAVAEAELQPVLKALRAGGIDIVAIHHHMTGESPRILFLHYWGRGKAVDLAATVKKALDLTAYDRPAT
jgi:hypothetical protein